MVWWMMVVGLTRAKQTMLERENAPGHVHDLFRREHQPISVFFDHLKPTIR
jgi:hypothetical protein